MISCSLLGVTVAAGQAEGMPGTESSDTHNIAGTNSANGAEETPDTEKQELTASEISGLTDSAGAMEESPDMKNQDGMSESLEAGESQGTVAEPPGAGGNHGMAAEPPEAGENQDASSKLPEAVDIPDKMPKAGEHDIEGGIPEAAAIPEGEILSLQIPERLGVVIDPWEIAGKGQIYSEQFTVRNTGEASGVLTLSFVCRRVEGSTAIIRTDNLGLHDDESKSIYIEMIFGDADRMVLTEAGLEYQTELQPGEEMTVSFAGEVNEYASEGWGDGDVEIEGVYLWDTAEGADAEAQSDVNGREGVLSSEAEDAEGTEGETAIDGNVLPGNDSAEGTDSSAAAEPTEGGEGQDGDVKEDGESEPQDGEEQNGSSDSKDAPDGNRTEETDVSQSGTDSTESAESAEGEENSSLSSGEDGETAAEESEGLSAPKDIDAKDGAEINPDGGEDSLPMEDVGGEAEPGLENAPETLPGNVEEDPQQEIEDADITGTDSQETGQNLEMDGAEDGREG